MSMASECEQGVDYASEVTVGEIIRYLNSHCAKASRAQDWDKARAYATASSRISDALHMFHECEVAPVQESVE
jgi:hypothetical protein